MTDQEAFELRAQAAAGLALAEQAISFALALAVAQGITIDFASAADVMRRSDPVGAEGTALALARRAHEIAASYLDRFSN